MANVVVDDRAVLVADLSHYDGADPKRHPAAWRLGGRLRGTVRAATARPAGLRLESALPCDRRPGHRRCAGHRANRGPPGVSWSLLQGQ